MGEGAAPWPGLQQKWRDAIRADVGGYDGTIDLLLRQLAGVLERPAKAARGYLLNGPHGAGKSHLALAVARATASDGGEPLEADVNVALGGSVDAALRAHDTLAAATKQAQAAKAKRAVEPSLIVVVVEGMEALLRRPGRDDPGSVEPALSTRAVVIESLLAALQEWCEELLPAVLIAPWAAAAPLPEELCGSGRLEVALTLPTPLGCRQRQEVLSAISRGMPTAGNEVLCMAANATAGFLPSDLVALCRAAALAAVRRSAASSTAACSRDAASDLAADKSDIITAIDFERALQLASPSQLRDVASAAWRPKARTLTKAFGPHPGRGLKAVVGQHVVVELLQSQVVGPFARMLQEEQLPADQKPPLGVLIEGCPGSGKTHVCVQLAVELGANIFAAAPADILASRVGEAEKRLASLFCTARQSAPSVLVLEDIGAFAPRSSDCLEMSADNEGCETRVAYVLRAELDRLRHRREAHAEMCRGAVLSGDYIAKATEGLVLVLATTVERSQVARWLQVPHRLALSVALTPQLSLEDLQELLQTELHDCGPDAIAIENVAKALCAGGAAKGSDVAALCRAAAVRTVRRAVAQGLSKGCGLSISIEDLQLAASTMQSSSGHQLVLQAA